MAEPENLPFIRVQLCLKKKDEVTDEFFHNYWKGNHVKLALENKKFVDKVIRYNQVSLLTPSFPDSNITPSYDPLRTLLMLKHLVPHLPQAQSSSSRI
jgi:hypothetical protein